MECLLGWFTRVGCNMKNSTYRSSFMIWVGYCIKYKQSNWMWEVSQFSSLRMGLGFWSTVLLVLAHCDLTQVSEVFYISAAQPKNVLFFSPSLPASFDCCKWKGRSTLKNYKKFSNLVMFLKHSVVSLNCIFLSYYHFAMSSSAALWEFYKGKELSLCLILQLKQLFCKIISKHTN